MKNSGEQYRPWPVVFLSRREKVFLNSIFLDWTTLEATGLSSSIYSIRLVLQGLSQVLVCFLRSALRREPWTENEGNAFDRERVAVSPQEESWQSPAVPWDLCCFGRILMFTQHMSNFTFLRKIEGSDFDFTRRRGEPFSTCCKACRARWCNFSKREAWNPSL